MAPLVNSLGGAPKFVMLFREDELEGLIEEEFVEKEEEDDLKYFNTFPTREELEYHEWLLKNPHPSWVRAKVRKGNLSNIKIPCMIGYFLKEQIYIDLESPINVMSRLYYYWIMNDGLKSREKLLNPRKTCKFVGRVRDIEVFLGNFTYEFDLMVLEYVSSFIDHYMGRMVLGKPSVKQSKLTNDKEEGTIMFEKNKVTFKMPYNMESMKNANLIVQSLSCEPSCLGGEPEFVMLFREEELEEEIEEEFLEEEEEDDLEYFNTFPTREEL
ncbi:hypothetical protein Tco_1502660 [Tanacetum coccineum]